MKRLSRGHVRAGIHSVRSTKMRSFWTMLGVIIGVASVITVVSIGTGIKKQVSGQIHQFGDNLITIRPGQAEAGGNSGAGSISFFSGLNASGPLTYKDISTVSRVRGVGDSAPLTIASGSVSGDSGLYRPGFAIGTSSSLPSLINQSMAYGSFLTDEDDGVNAAVVGHDAAEEMFNVDVPLGRSFTFRGETFIVRGVFNKFPSAPLSQQLDFNKAVFIPNDVAERLSNNTAPTYAILVRPDDTKRTGTAVASIQRALAKTHGGQSGFSVEAGSKSLAESNNILELLTKLIAGVASISLLVGGLGIMNVMLVSVTERKHEIGIRKAIGATNRQILSQFMVESSVLSLWGGIIGVIVALLIDVVLRLFTDIQPSISWQIVLLATGVSLMVGVIFGTVPAVKAARKDPIEALRSE